MGSGVAGSVPGRECYGYVKARFARVREKGSGRGLGSGMLFVGLNPLICLRLNCLLLLLCVD